MGHAIHVGDAWFNKVLSVAVEEEHEREMDGLLNVQ